MKTKYSFFWLCIVSTLLVLTDIWAGDDPIGEMASVDLETKRVAAQLVATCCWSQTADVHHSAAAEAMIERIRVALLNGKTEDEIIQMFVDEYGERVRAVPKPEGIKSMLWIIPFIVLITGSAILMTILTRQKNKMKPFAEPAASPMDDSILKRIHDELKSLER